MPEPAKLFKLEPWADLRQAAAPDVLAPVGELADEPVGQHSHGELTDGPDLGNEILGAMDDTIARLASQLDFTERDLIPWGPSVAKISPATAFKDDPTRARLVLVSAISPTPAGIGKTTMTIGLTQAARRAKIAAVAALRQPSLGPVFGQKGGGAGGGRSTLEPMERVNLGLTGDLHAVTSAHNLLAALIDNEIYFQGATRLDHRAVTHRRVLDMNDRFLRKTIIGLGGKAMGVPREDGFDITAASEVMAVLCFARDYSDLKRRLGDLLIGYTSDGKAVFARDLKAEGAMAALLRDALSPNLVATQEGAPALVHGGPFGNIAHGCNSLVATRLAMRRADVVFTEAGFGFDLGAEKFLDIKCRVGNIWPSTVVLVATLRALKYHGGVAAADTGHPDGAALARGIANLERHIESVRSYGLEPVVALNIYNGDSDGELAEVIGNLRAAGVEAGIADVYGKGGEGAVDLVERVVAQARAADPKPKFQYELSDAPADKIRKIAQNIYGARAVVFTQSARADIDRAVALGFGELPVCIAKTHLSLSDDPKRVGRPRDFEITVREVRISAGAGFLVSLTGEILTMPGLPKVPHAQAIDLLPDGTIVGAT
jgi:formate--tetrahydrofolate ligase